MRSGSSRARNIQVIYWTAAAILGSAGATLWALHPQPIATLAVAIASGALGGFALAVRVRSEGVPARLFFGGTLLLVGNAFRVTPSTADVLRLPHGIAFVAVQVATALVAAAVASCASPVPSSRRTSTRS